MAAILIVEDERDLAVAWSEALAIDGHEITIAGTGAEAASIMKGQNFDIVVTDINMPDGGGMYVSGMTRMLQGHRRIIVVSGYLAPTISGTTNRDALSGLGVRRFLSKPIELEDLRQAISDSLEEES